MAFSEEVEIAGRARVDRSPEQKLAIVLVGLKSGNIAETSRRRHEIALNFYYCCKGEAPARSQRIR